jgi:hypothetical protein
LARFPTRVPEELALFGRELDQDVATAPAADVVLGFGDVATHLCDHPEKRFLRFNRAPLCDGLAVLGQEMERSFNKAAMEVRVVVSAFLAHFDRQRNLPQRRPVRIGFCSIYLSCRKLLFARLRAVKQ